MPRGRRDAPRPLSLGMPAAIVAAYPVLRDLLAGHGPLLLPTGDATPDPPTSTGTPYLREFTGVAIGTSGSTGVRKRAVLPTAALRASIEATHERLGGPARWLLALPAQHIAGLQVVLRSLAAGHEPALLPANATGAAFAAGFAATARDASGRWYTSLVPAQLTELLADPGATGALRRAAAVLCGGAALPEPLRARAVAAGIPLVTTYGMSETSGGCVYDGRPLTGVGVRLEDGGVVLGGPTVAAGYLDDPHRSAAAFTLDAAGTRWFAADDIGELTDDGRLVVRGRRDDVITTGGYKVAPAVVEAAVSTLAEPGSQVVVVGVPHRRWGQAVVAAIATPGPRTAGTGGYVDVTDRLRPALRAALPGYAVPHRIVRVDTLPLIGPGKVDRAALARALAAEDGLAAEWNNGDTRSLERPGDAGCEPHSHDRSR